MEGLEKIKKRGEIDDNFKWRITDFYAADEDWENDFNAAAESISTFAEDSGTFTKSRESFVSFLQKYENASHLVEKVYVYAHLKMFEDVGNDKYQSFSAKTLGLYANFSQATAFLRPEIIAMDEKTVSEYVSGTLFEHAVREILTQKPHTLSNEIEALLASASEVADIPSQTFTMLNNADIKFNPIQDENGNEIDVTNGRYGLFLDSENRQIRADAFNSIHRGYKNLQNTIAANYAGCVKKDIFFSKARKHESSLHMYLSQNNIPVEVYGSLIDAVHEFLPSFQKYMKLRREKLGYDELYAYDLRVSIVPQADTSMTYEQAKNVIADGLAPLGAEYVSDLKKAFDSGWIDVYENEGKRTGAFQWGVYGTHPFVMMNYDGKFDSMLTLAHEMGHAMHAFYSFANQPYLYSSAPIFLAEIASTVNESLLMKSLIQKEQNPAQKAFYVNYVLDQFRTTLFRQAMFAEFELIAHETAEKGTPLTAKLLNSIYKELMEKYHGEGFVCTDENEAEWARIPHFYTPFYVYQYSTGFSAAMAFSKMIMDNEEGAAERYLSFLKSGSNDFPIEILKKAGLDMTKPEVIHKALTIFDESVDNLTELLNSSK